MPARSLSIPGNQPVSVHQTLHDVTTQLTLELRWPAWERRQEGSYTQKATNPVARTRHRHAVSVVETPPPCRPT